MRNMGEDGSEGERASGVVARFIGNTVSPFVTMLMALASAAMGHPEMMWTSVPVGAAAGVAVEDAARALGRAWAEKGVQALQEDIEEETGEEIGTVVSRVWPDRKATRLLAEAVTESAQAVDDWAIRNLARAFVLGAKNPAELDHMRDLIRMMSGLEEKHARVMAVLRKPNDSASEHKGSYVYVVDEVAKVDAALGHTVAILAGDLEKAGLVNLQHNLVALSPKGWSCAALLDVVGSMPEAQTPDS